MKVRLVTSTTGHNELQGKSMDEIMVYLARVSSNKSIQDKFVTPEKLIRYCWREKHVSIFETCTIGFEIETSVAIATQILRHRSAYFQQLSRRYSDEDVRFEDIELRMKGSSNRQGSLDEIIPNHEKVSKLIDHQLVASKILYNKLLDEGVAAEVARFVLPQNTMTTLYMTTNVRNFIFYIESRLSSHAQKEHRIIAEEIKKEFKQLLPIVSEAVWGND